MKFATFNIRCDFNQDGENSFSFRKPLILRTISEKQPLTSSAFRRCCPMWRTGCAKI